MRHVSQPVAVRPNLQATACGYTCRFACLLAYYSRYLYIRPEVDHTDILDPLSGPGQSDKFCAQS